MNISIIDAERMLEEQKQKCRVKAPASNGDVDHDPDPGPESDLSNKIRGYCRDNGYPAQINRQTKQAKGLLEPGWPDCTICLPEGRVLFLELKTGKGRLSDEQVKTKLKFMSMAHEWHVVRSYRRFLEIVGDNI